MAWELARTVRFTLPLTSAGSGNPFRQEKVQNNSYAGGEIRGRIGGYFELEVAVHGSPDPVTGYLLNISSIDQAVRRTALPLLWDLIQTDQAVSPASVLPQLLAATQPALGNRISRMTWRLSPYHSQSIMSASPEHILISQQFEFSASHRLNVDSITPQQNREVFGKCNNPNGHGHNYRIEPTVAVMMNPPANGAKFTIIDFERIVSQTIIQRFDHKHLNLDTQEFAHLNPSVENISRVCHDLLREPLSNAGAELRSVTVWETEKTRCTYPA